METGSIFKALRDSRAKIMNESKSEKPQDQQALNEEAEAAKVKETKADEGSANKDDQAMAVNEEYVILTCPKCGPLAGLNEEDVDGCPICDGDELLEKI